MGYESWRVYIGFTRDPNDRGAPLTDVTSYVDTVRQPIVITRGRTSERATIQNATCSFALTNADQRFTPGNPLSPYAPWVLSGRRVVVTDQVGSEEFALFDGFLEFPDADSWQKSSTTGLRDQVVSVSAVDLVARLDGGRSFDSTFAAHILANGGPALIAYWPLIEAGLPLGDRRGGPAMVPTLLVSSASPDAGVARVGFNEGTAPPSDDGRPVLMTCATSGPDSVRSHALVADFTGLGFSLNAGEVFTVIAWIRADFATRDELVTPISLDVFDGVVDLQRREFTDGSFPGLWRLTKPIGTLTGAVNSTGQAVSDVVYPVAMRWGYSPNVIELWVGREVFTGSLTGTLPPPLGLTSLQIAGVGYEGSISHVQLYTGSPADWDHDDFLSQVDVGHAGLVRQRVDERVTTLASYAGLDTAELDLDVASALMPKARLAGQKPGALMRTAADADNGLLFTNGSGRIAFHSRARRYNPLLAATVDLTWLEPPLSWRTDPPTNAMDVTSTTGAEGHAVNADSTAEFTERSGSASLDTACEADPANLAAFTVREFARPRQRADRLVFELRTRTAAQKTLILRREISDRIALSGLPDTAPEGTNTFHIEGIRHVISVAGHRVEMNTGAVLGDVPGVVQPYPRVGQAVVREETRIPF